MRRLLFPFLCILQFSCQPNEAGFAIDEDYLSEFEKKTEGGLAYNRPYYLQLISFSKLEPMTANRFGTASDNEHIIEATNAPSTFGSIEILQDSIRFSATKGLVVKTEEDSEVEQITLPFDELGNTADLYHGSFSWRVVAYGQDKYLRVRDLESPALKNFPGCKRFDLTSDFIFRAQFTPFDPPRVVTVPSSVDFERTATFIGTLSFEYKDKNYTLDVQDGHIMFSDETSALQTYGSGRYLKFDEPDEDGTVILDFNYAYNPPCIFSKYTTCLFPPPQNRLPFEVLAGEIVEEL